MEWHGKIRGRCERRPRMRDWRPVPWCWEAGVVRTPAPKVFGYFWRYKLQEPWARDGRVPANGALECCGF